MWMALLGCMAVCALVPACLFLTNVGNFKTPRAAPQVGPLPYVAVLIPARNEEDNIAEALRCVLASRGVRLEALVYDDASTDSTAALVLSVAAQDARVRLVKGAALQPGWNGKQHACFHLAQASTASLLLFVDADVRLEPDAIALCAAEREASAVALLSGFPRIITKTSMEWLVLPLIQWVLLGLLPMWRMRTTTVPAYAAGCGQFMLAERDAYFCCGGHAAIRETRHDGLRLPKLFREHRLRTDICDLTELASVRMYDSAAAVWNGLAKNATEGLGSPGKIVPLTFLLAMGQVLPGFLAYICAGLAILWPLIAVMLGVFGMDVHLAHLAAVRVELSFCGVAVLASFGPRLLGYRRFHQPLRSALLHPVGIAVLLMIQWYALARQVLAKPVEWRARNYPS